jgi:nucleoside-diphosphate-sugar epimerase
LTGRVLVTGGAGFLGRAFAAHARRAGYETLALDAERGADVVCDLADPQAVRDALAATRPRAVVHLAARLTDAGNADPLGAVIANCVGSAALFVGCEHARVERVVYASSIAAVGPCAHGSGDATPLAPGNVYGATKAFGEHLARALCERPDAPACLALRFGWIYGPGRARGWREPQDIVERVIAGERRVRYPEFPEPIDWTWIDDAAELLVRALACPLPRRFIAVNAMGDRRRVGDAFVHLKRRFPDLAAEPFASALPPAGWGLVDDGVDALLGPLARTRLEEGLDRMIALGSRR